MNSLHQKKQISCNFFYTVFSLLVLFYIIFILTSCAKPKAIFDQNSFDYDIEESGLITMTILVTNESNKIIESTNILIDLYDSENKYIETISGTSDKLFFGIKINNYIYPSGTKTVEIYAQISNPNVKYIELNEVDFNFEVTPNYLGLLIFLGIFIVFINALVYFTTRVTEYYNYKGHRIKAATRFMKCYIEVDGKRVASNIFLRWGSTIEVSYADISNN